MNEGSTIYLIVILFCVAMSATFSATETAFSTFNRIRMKNLAADGDKRAELVMKLAEEYDSLLSTILIGNNIVNIAASSIATILFVDWLGTSGAAVSTAVTTVVVLIFGEISPKSLAKESPDAFVKFIAPFIRVIKVLFTPVNFLFGLWKKLLAKIFKSSGDQAMTGEELMTIVDEAEHDGGIGEQEGELIRSAIEFDDVEAADIITPRVDIVAVPEDATFEEISDVFHESGYSRLPVYRDTIDNIIGVIHEKDFYHMCHHEGHPISVVLGKVLNVPCHIKISKLLTSFQCEKAHMAVVLDDYGGTMGIATLEDVLEELVGEIWDEHDEVVELLTPQPDGSLIISGTASPDELFGFFELKVDDDELPQTVNGWVTRILGELPNEGDSFDSDGLHITVLKTDGKLVERVRAELIEPEEDEEDSKDKDKDKEKDKEKSRDKTREKV